MRKDRTGAGIAAPGLPAVQVRVPEPPDGRQADSRVLPIRPRRRFPSIGRGRLIAALALLLAAVGVWFYLRSSGMEPPVYRFGTVERGDLAATVSATGALAAITTVQVGTQVSGQVSAIYADFNDRVRRGQLIARIDPTLQRQAVRDAEAGLERTRAEVTKAQQDHDRNQQLFAAHVLTEIELATSTYALDVARAGDKSAQVSLERARQNLAYTSIFAPIDGIVVERNVDVGQTVAASLQAPQLFLIANDLSRMQILASVDESDIGQIVEGQPVRFTVPAYPDGRFAGTVRQVRLQSTMQENIVNYSAVVEVENPGGKLLPGMTATVDFLTGSAWNVLTVPNAAARFRATDAMLEEAGETASTRGTTLWYLDAAGRLARVQVTTGLTDGQRTEVRGEGLTEGMRIIVGISQQTGTGAATSSPFQSQPQTGGPPPPGRF
jgi:HlyD family secretion protein